MAHAPWWQLPNMLLVILLQALLVSAQNGDGGASTGFSGTDLGAAGTGAEGSSSSSANLSQGAIIAIAVVVALVVSGGGKFDFVKIICASCLTWCSSHPRRPLLSHKEATVANQTDHPQNGDQCRARNDTKDPSQDDLWSRVAEGRQEPSYLRR